MNKITNYLAMTAAMVGLCMIGQTGARAQDTSAQPSYNQNANQQVPANVPGNVPNNTHAKTAWRMDHRFVRTAAEGGMAEVDLGRLAQTKATDPAVKDLGNKMVRDHSEANAKLQQIAANVGIAPPAKMSMRERRERARLERLSGPAFDKAYTNYMVRDHRYAVSNFQRESKWGHNEQLKNFAAQTLPVLHNHLQSAERIQARLG